MSQDKLTICPRCGSDACYEQDLGADYKVHMCYGCGFTTNSLMTEKSEFLAEQLEVLPELYKDLVHVDKDHRHWIPSTINVPDKGMIFINGTDAYNWKWNASPAVKIPEEDLDRFPEGTTHRIDQANAKEFSEREFIEALDYIGFFN
jgi:hypothetical protein